MSRWSAREPPGGPAVGRESDRGVVRPLPALIAAAVLCAAVSLYATTLHDRTPASDRDLTAPTADDAVETLTATGVADPDRIDAAARKSGPDGSEVALTLTAPNRTWTAGPEPPDGAASTARRVPVRVGPGRVRPGEVRVVVWS